VIYRRGPINDKPTEEFEWGDYYENGTTECYELFRSKAKIPTYKALKWHLYVICYLNPNMLQNEFETLVRHICNKENGFITFNINDQLLQNIMHDVFMQDLETPPYNKTRKIIFKDNSGLTTNEKLSIVGHMIGKTKKVNESDIYEAMLYMHDLNNKITIKKLAEYLKCTVRTIHRNMSNELKKEKETLNKNL
jgi:transcriptional antiterminator